MARLPDRAEAGEIFTPQLSEAIEQGNARTIDQAHRD
jgi:hypothetical protein